MRRCSERLDFEIPVRLAGREVLRKCRQSAGRVFFASFAILLWELCGTELSTAKSAKNRKGSKRESRFCAGFERIAVCSFGDCFQTLRQFLIDSTEAAVGENSDHIARAHLRSN